MKKVNLLFALAVVAAARCAVAADEIPALREAVRAKGWIAYTARSPQGDYDIFLMRPDGSAVTNITRTPDFNEAYPLFSRDGSRLLWRRLTRGETIDGNNYGAQGAPVIARADGGDAKPLGGDGELPWASWSPDGRQLLCLAPKGLQIVDIATRKVVRTIPRKGFFQQPTWSPDGKSFVGVANSFGESWSIGKMDAASGEASAVNVQDCCTPDWFPDSQNVMFSWRPQWQFVGGSYGWTQLWRASADGKNPQLIYAENGRHAYGGHVSPDGRYVLFTGNVQEDGDPKNAGAPMSLIRLADAPIIVGASDNVRTKFPDAKSGPVLALPAGWEPCWTAAEIKFQ